jgi:predicted ArsR family transcriptional regulator
VNQLCIATEREECAKVIDDLNSQIGDSLLHEAAAAIRARGLDVDRKLEPTDARLELTAAYLLEYWADKGVIPRYDGVINGLRDVAADKKTPPPV